MSQSLPIEIDDLVAQIDTNLAPIVGQQVTWTAASPAATGTRVDLLIDRAETPFVLKDHPGATDCDLIVKATVGSAQRGWVYDSDAQLFQSDDSADPLLTDAQLRSAASTGGYGLTYTCVPPGSGVRTGIDRDEDNVLDADDNCPSVSNPTQDASACAGPLSPSQPAALAPAPPTIDSFMLYKSKKSRGTAKFEKREVIIRDPLFDEERTIRVIKPKWLGVPLDLAQPPFDGASHLEGYKAKRATGEEKHVKQQLFVGSRLGELLVDTNKETILLMPTAMSTSSPIGQPLDPGEHSLESFLCYKVKKPKPFLPIASLSVTEAFESRDYDLIKPDSICNPVEVDGSAVRNPRAHLLCFKAKRSSGQPKHTRREGLHTHTTFGAYQSDTKKSDRLCVTATRVE